MTKHLITYVILTNKDVDVFDCLLDVMFSLNNCSSSVTGLTPHFVFHGFETVDPTDNNLQLANSLPSAPVQFAEVLQQENIRRYELVKNCKEAAACEMKYNFDRSIVALPNFQPRDLVLVESHNHPRNSTSMRKFKVHRRGPYYIHAIDGYHCVLRDVDGHILNDLFPIRKLQKIDGHKETFPADRETVNVSQFFYSSSLDSDDSELDNDVGSTVFNFMTKLLNISIQLWLYVPTETRWVQVIIGTVTEWTTNISLSYFFLIYYAYF